ncbi:MAG TPA: thioredoxin family protein [Candidatus Krumholzibacteria bacterium]|nr:thioredoxin family protein [Candidatus Krumholzibacteria bacterium]
MSRIQILGPGCQKCQALYERTRQAAREMGIDCEIEKVTDIDQMLSFGIMSTPALVVDGTVKVFGHVPSVANIKAMLS